MRIGIGLPSTIPGTPGDVVFEWARKAEVSQFSSLSVLDRVVYPNYEPLIALAGAAGVTQRIGLITTVLLAPLRNTILLAKQAASLDALSGGRLTLGLGVGGRQDDFAAVGASFGSRGRDFEEQLATMTRVWAGEPPAPGMGLVGPARTQPGRPEMLLGGYAPAAIRRLARWGTGYIAGGGPPDVAQRTYAAAEAVWNEAGRASKPRFVAGMYFGLGADAAERAAVYIRHYYSFRAGVADGIVAGLPTTPDAVKARIQSYQDVGVDELILWPCIGDLDQVDRLAGVVG